MYLRVNIYHQIDTFPFFTVPKYILNEFHYWLVIAVTGPSVYATHTNLVIDYFSPSSPNS